VKIDKMSKWLKGEGEIIIRKIRFKLLLQMIEIALGSVGIEIIEFFGKGTVGCSCRYTNTLPPKKEQQSEDRPEKAIQERLFPQNRPSII
jgi:hypothetical protein